MSRLARLLALALFGGTVAALAGPTIAQPGKKATPVKPADGGKFDTITAEGIGKDEKEAKKAAFRDAVSRVVGTLVDAETLVKNDQVISERILEFSGGFVKTYDVLKTETTTDGLVRVRIKATVERLQIAGRLADVKVATKEVRGQDLLAEKMTKEEAKKNATELLAKLYADLPKLLRAEAKGQPQLTDTRDGVYVDVAVSVDVKGYQAFVKRAVLLLDKIAIAKDSMLVGGSVAGPRVAGKPGSIPATQPRPGQEGLRYDRSFAHLPELGQNTPKGYAIWLLTGIDGTATQMRWNLYWVDADLAESLKPIVGEARLHIHLTDKDDTVVVQDEISLFNVNSQYNGSLGPGRDTGRAFPINTWLLFSFSQRDYYIGREKRDSGTLFIAPVLTQLTPHYQGEYLLSRSIRRSIKVTDDDLARFKQVKTFIELHPVEPDKRR